MPSSDKVAVVGAVDVAVEETEEVEAVVVEAETDLLVVLDLRAVHWVQQFVLRS